MSENDKNKDKEERCFETLALHAGQEPDAATGARAVPIHATSSYVFESADHAAKLFAGEAAGNQYGRMHNPTVQAFTERLVALENGRAGLALSSGQAATTAALLTLAAPGKHIIFSNQLFGGTFSVARKILEPWGCAFSVVEPTPEEVAGAVQDNTVAVWCESIGNPSCGVPDIAAIAAVCRDIDVPFLVDNTWGCGGYLCRPLDLGADVVIHSATKWIGGHGTFVGGAIVDAGRYNWSNGKFPAFTSLDSRGRTYVSRSDTPFTLRAYDLGLFTMGMTLSPHSAFLGLQGLETLPLRVQRSCDSALELARWLSQREEVKRVLYPGLESHPCHEAAKQTLQNGFGAVLSFETHSLEDTKRFLDSVRLASHLANIGDAKTVVINPWTTTHAGLDERSRRNAGVTPELIRVSVGLENLTDIRADFEQALTPVTSSARQPLLASP